MSEILDVEALKKKAEKPKKLAMEYHPFYKGKIGVGLKAPVRDFHDFDIWYTPGVAGPCMDIYHNPEKVYEHTNKGNFVAVVSDGTRVLGLGDIGPEAGMPVMEGKGMLFKYLGGVDAFPICLNTKDPDEIIQAVKWLTPSFGGINLEDLSKPKCYYILERLRKELPIPVWHDDQQGTALVTLAGVINALKVVGKKMNEVKMTFVGAGAANMNCIKYIEIAGANFGNMKVVDRKGILNMNRKDLEDDDPVKWDICKKTNKEGKSGDIKEALIDADVCIALSKPGPDTIKKDWIRDMADDSIVMVCANPIPEIWPWEAKEAGAKIVATGRSDFENQVNNSLGFPAVFRGTLDVYAKEITDEMCITAAYAVADYAEEEGNKGSGISESYIIPRMDETGMFIKESVAVSLKAISQGVARLKLSEDELAEKASLRINHSQKQAQFLMKEKFIEEPPEVI